MNDIHQNIDGRSLAIAALAVTACILFVGLLLITTQPAQAIGELDRAGDYIMLTQQLSSSQEGCVIIDAASRQMSVYALNNSNKQLQVIHPNIDLTQLPGSRRLNQQQP